MGIQSRIINSISGRDFLSDRFSANSHFKTLNSQSFVAHEYLRNAKRNLDRSLLRIPRRRRWTADEVKSGHMYRLINYELQRGLLVVEMTAAAGAECDARFTVTKPRPLKN